MAEYTFNVDPTGWSHQYLQAKIYDVLGLNPSTLTLGTSMGGEVIIDTDRDLTQQELNKLNRFFNEGGNGLRPALPGYTLFEMPDLVTQWGPLETKIGGKFKYVVRNDTTGKLEIWLEGNVGDAMQNKIINAIKETLVRTTY